MRYTGALLFCISIILCACGKRQEPTNADSVAVADNLIERPRQPTATDTLIEQKEIFLSGKSFLLTRTKHSAIEISLAEGGDEIFKKVFTKDMFKSQLYEEYYHREELYDIQYDFAKEDKLYFTATFLLPDTSWIDEVVFGVFYRREKSGQIDFVESGLANKNVLELYDFMYHENDSKERLGFISMSDNYRLSDNPDSLAIPDVASVSDDTYFKLESTYRERFLTKMKISETDKVFIYNYHFDTLLHFSVKSLDVVACLSPYIGEDEGPFAQEDYMIGFGLDNLGGESFGNYYAETVAFIGRDNPFIRGKVKPIAWRKVSRSNFPSVKALRAKHALLRNKYREGDVYHYTYDHFEYFAQEFFENNEAERSASARHLVIIDRDTKELVRDVFYVDSEGSTQTPLNGSHDQDTYYQWTGMLLKDKPPVFFGFEYVSFGCPEIKFIDKTSVDLVINCDNRH